MIVTIDFEAMKTVVTHRICKFHVENPGKSYAGCTCSSSFGYVVKEEKDE